MASAIGLDLAHGIGHALSDAAAGAKLSAFSDSDPATHGNADPAAVPDTNANPSAEPGTPGSDARRGMVFAAHRPEGRGPDL